MRDFRQKVVVVTGAAGGIGRALALAFAARGASVVAVDVDGNRLAGVKGELEAAGAEARAYAVDVSNADEVGKLCDDVFRDMGRADVLCNNAGVAAAGDFESLTLDDLRWVVEVNLMGVINGCRSFYPRMIEQGRGHIVNTASAGGIAPFPALNIYCATKFGVVGFSETLRAEAALHGIGVTVICPGVIATDIVERSRVRSGSLRTSPHDMGVKVDRIIKGRGYAPERVAAAAIKAVERNVGVARIAPESYLMDYTYRISRRLYGTIMTNAARVAQRIM
jgi:NAD(P)-dependent dehydrogenase (short-subunit alcohol dehydrogenase family)